jgi:Ni/Co efflux regulator RcnB
MSYLSDDDDDDNNNNRSGVNVQDELIENPADESSTYKRDKIISSKINRFAEGFKIPNDKKRKKAKISRYK